MEPNHSQGNLHIYARNIICNVNKWHVKFMLFIVEPQFFQPRE